jgi:CPA1 family monovalent cation:H+ antiporter
LAQWGLLLLAAAVVAIITRRVGLPYTVGLVLAGAGLAFLPLNLHVQLSKELIFSVLLPPLVFEAALNIEWRELRIDLPVVTTLATVGVLIAAAITAAGMHYGIGWSWDTATVFGVLISATDPVSVIATFKEAKVVGRMRLLVEAESLLNDGTAAVALGVVLTVVSGGVLSGASIAYTIATSIGGGILCGSAIALGLMALSGRTEDPLVEFTLTTLAAYGSFLVAEHYLFSGVLASLTAGLIVGNSSVRGSLSPRGRKSVESFWEYIAFIANSIVFLLIGIREAEQQFGDLWLAAGIATIAVLIGRAAVIYGGCALFRRSRRPVSFAHQHVLVWGGLRGALALALALGLPDSVPLRETIITVAFAVVAFSIFVQGMTMTPVLRLLDQLPDKSADSTR